MERTLQTLQTKMNYICKMNQSMQAGKGADGGETSVLLRLKRYVDNNRAITAMFMLFLNIGSRYINLNITTSQEYYLRKMLIPEVLIFCVSWMGSRDILIAACITFVYSLMTRVFFNENSNFCIVKHKMKEIKQLIDTNNDQKVSDKELDNAIHVLSKAKESHTAQTKGASGATGYQRRETPTSVPKETIFDDVSADTQGAEGAEGADDFHTLTSPIIGGGSYGLDYGVENEMTTFGNDPIFEPMKGMAATASSALSASVNVEPFTNLPSV